MAELPDPGSLPGRVAPGGKDGPDGRRRYELIAGRYPHSSEIVFSAPVRLPVSDITRGTVPPSPEEMASRALLPGRQPDTERVGTRAHRMNLHTP